MVSATECDRPEGIGLDELKDALATHGDALRGLQVVHDPFAHLHASLLQEPFEARDERS